MKELTRIKLINWHYFENETIEIKGSTLITGDNGTGKSTILDAIQYVLVADLRKVKFNASTINEPKRDLLGYLRCRTGNEGESSPACLRQGDITSYVVLEFYDNHRRKHFLLGVVVDSYADGKTWNSSFFKVEDCRLEEGLFLTGQRPRNIRELKVALKDRKATIYATMEQYQADLRVKLGSLSERFFSLFVKAISFKPITDIRQFVYSYLLEEKHVNIEVMKENFQRYKEYSDLAAQTREKLAFLSGVINKFNEIAKIQHTALVQDYLILRGNWEYTVTRLAVNLKDMEEKEEELKRTAERLQAVRLNEERCKKECEEYRDTLAANSTYQLMERLNEVINNLTLQRQELEKSQETVKSSAASEVVNLEKLLVEGEGYLGPEEKMSLRVLIGLFRSLAKGRLPDGVVGTDGEASAREQIACGVTALEALEHRFHEQIWEITRQKKELVDEEKGLENDLTSLQNKKFIYDRKVTELRDLISEKFWSEKGIAVEPKVLCELLEVPDEKWQDAVEGWLNTQRFDLIIEPEYFDYALSVYEQYKKERRIAGVGLVNTGRVLKFLDRMEPSSLVEEVRSENRYALAYVRQLMGNVIKCENEHQLKQHYRAITPTGMTYVNNTARQIKFEVCETPFIGERAYARQIARKEVRLAEIKSDLERLREEIAVLESMYSLCSIRDGRYTMLQERLNVFDELAAVERRLDDKKQELAAVDTSGIAQIREQIKGFEQSLTNLREEIEEYIKTHTELKMCLDQLGQQHPALMEKVEEAEGEFKYFVAHYPEVVERGAFRYEKELRTRPPGIIAANFLHNRKSLETSIVNLQNELTSLKSQYNSIYHFGGKVEPTEIDDYAGEQQKLVESELPEYEEKINQAKREAEQEFKEHFIYKLRENIENARNEFSFLNDALKPVSFGGDSYRFLVEPSVHHRRFFDMIMDTHLVEGGMSLFDSMFQERHREAMDELFDKIINTPAERLSENIVEYTDYRTFLDYDIKITSANGENCFFSKVCREKSGGETQTPYYVAIVASFVQLYRARTNRDSIRLMMFDEAFNRMDSDRVENSLRFINELGMQVIIAVPTDKCEYITPHVPTTLLALRDGHYRWIEDYKQLKLEEEETTVKEAGNTVA